MTATQPVGQATPLPADALSIIDGYRTCEFATIGKDGVPIAWPTCALYDAERGTITVTTSIGLPTKAFNVRRNPRVSLLFSDPTGSGLADQRQVFIVGDATCPKEIVTSPAGFEDYWRRLFERQPSGRRYGATGVSRRLMDWYYMRLVITVVPDRLEMRAPLQTADRVARRTRIGQGDDGARVLRELPGFTSSVLSWRDETGSPRSARVLAVADAGGQVVLTSEEPLTAGPASLLSHSHNDELAALRSFVARGRVDSGADGWGFVPDRYVPGAAPTPGAALRMLRGARRSAQRYLDTRGRSRPTIPWDEYRSL